MLLGLKKIMHSILKLSYKIRIKNDVYRWPLTLIMTWKLLHTICATQWPYCASLMKIGQGALKLEQRLSFQVKILEIWPQMTFDLDHEPKIAPQLSGYPIVLLCKFDDNRTSSFEIRAKVKFSG